VADIRVLTTQLRSLKNERVVLPDIAVPNAGVIEHSTRACEQGLTLHTTVGIGYATLGAKVEAMLRRAADRAGGLLNERNPCMLWQAVGDHAVNHEIDAHSNDANDMAQIDSAPPRPAISSTSSTSPALPS
jgi:small-conductance mechanosensitive channel